MNLIFLPTFNCSNSSSTVCIWRKTNYPFLTVTTLSDRTLWVALLKFNTWKHINRARQRGDEKFGKTLEGVPLFLWKHFAFMSINLVFPAVFWCRIFVYKQKITNFQVFKSFFPTEKHFSGTHRCFWQLTCFLAPLEYYKKDRKCWNFDEGLVDYKCEGGLKREFMKLKWKIRLTTRDWSFSESADRKCKSNRRELLETVFWKSRIDSILLSFSTRNSKGCYTSQTLAFHCDRQQVQSFKVPISFSNEPNVLHFNFFNRQKK